MAALMLAAVAAFSFGEVKVECKDPADGWRVSLVREIASDGAEKYLNDLCELFRDYGWDWTYHAFREASFWSVEHEGASFHEMKPAKNTPRRMVLEKFLKGDRKEECEKSKGSYR